ncbi:unnamed protein product [Oppiella nova]|uniref:Protein kinase domain-containing protein n=1 Tax=Oppiella nova TaxID=334625 RepID=A0A7R9LKA0_9ACAR|nr:unnamed protein product [Oppiella nova]CAG2164073.1 unnamed protein product [Oppiella nova]
MDVRNGRYFKVADFGLASLHSNSSFPGVEYLLGTSPVFKSRSQSDDLLSTIGGIMSANLSTIASEAMTFFDLNNDNCKLEMSCKLGKRMASSMLYLQQIFKL